jgi:hypothetical protein
MRRSAIGFGAGVGEDVADAVARAAALGAAVGLAVEATAAVAGGPLRTGPPPHATTAMQSAMADGSLIPQA